MHTNSNSSRYKSSEGTKNSNNVFKKLAYKQSRDYTKYEQDKVQKETQNCSFKPEINNSRLNKSNEARSSEQLYQVHN